MEQNTENRALLVMDMQSAILGNLPGAKGVIENAGKAIQAAREKEIPVVYVRVGFRKGAPEISTRSKFFASRKNSPAAENPEEWMKIDPSLAPREDDVVVTKRRVSAFTGSDLEVVLRAQAIEHVILLGVVTSGVVLSTLREASDKDYRITVLSDCCADRDEEVHRVLMTKVFPRQADVMTLDEWIKS
ncbi:MAG TPA: isochorismatase family cysteine hydrolase [Ignavibacteriales bacterium]|nr:isochorismatase family cysteine hydrolase [Ignavibacteriales bacterium]